MRQLEKVLRCLLLGWLLLAAQYSTASFAESGGKLNIKLTVFDDANTEWKDGFVVSGVPLPKGLYDNPSSLCIVDNNGRRVPSQFSVLDRWWASKNQSIKWVLASFLADVSRNSERDFYLVNNCDVPAQKAVNSLELQDNAREIRVITGPLKFIISKTHFNLFDHVWLDLNKDGIFSEDEEIVSSSPDNGGIIISNVFLQHKTRGHLEKLADGEGTKDDVSHYSSTSLPLRVKVEDAGPLHATILIDGMHLARDKSGAINSYYGFRARIHAYAGQPYIKIVYSIKNTYLSNPQYVWPIKKAALDLKLNIINPAYFIMGEKKVERIETGKQSVRIYQGAPTEKSAKDKDLIGYRISEGEKEIERGLRSRGTVDISNHIWGLSVSLGRFWQQYPKGFQFKDNTISIELLMGDEAAPVYLDPGQQKTHEIVFKFHRGAGSERELMDLSRQVEYPLRFLAPSEWYSFTNAWDDGISGHSDKQSYTTKEASNLGRQDFGWQTYGTIGSFNSAGKHLNLYPAFTKYVHSRNIQEFNELEAMTLWYSDIVPLHWDTVKLNDDFDPLEYMGNHSSKLLSYLDYDMKAPVDWQRQFKHDVPDPEHMGALMLLEYYHLTGSRHALDALKHLGNRARAFLQEAIKGPGNTVQEWAWIWQFGRSKEKFTPKHYGWQPAGRDYGWVLYNLAQAYEATGIDVYKKDAVILAQGFLNTQRMTPTGYLNRTVHDAKSDKSYALRPPPIPAASSFTALSIQASICARALNKFWEETGDEDAKDGVLAYCDLLTYRALGRDSYGNPLGWDWAWGDYWDPTQYPASYSSNAHWSFEGDRDQSVIVLSGCYLISGNDDYLSVLKAAADKGSKMEKLEQVLTMSKSDMQAPDAVSDLRAAYLGNGKVQLIWSAPKDNGRGMISEYQVKYDSARIVEKVDGWPDTKGPLPKTQQEYLRLCEEFNRNQRSFALSNNVAGEPFPHKAGTKEEFILTGLHKGLYSFALKSYDDSGNQSALSNVVRVEVH